MIGKGELARLRGRYPKGSRVRLEYMDDPYAPQPGTLGTVMCVDDAGTTHIKWDNGSTLGVVYGVDKISMA